MESLANTWQILCESPEPILISAHIDPDGDAIGSSLGLWHLFQQHGKQAHIVLQSIVPPNLRFLPDSQSILCIPQIESGKIQALFDSATLHCILDLNNSSRLGPVIQQMGDSIVPDNRIVFDHHINPAISAGLQHIYTDTAATCEIIASMALAAGIEPSPKAATCLYTGIMTDTGGFRFPRTNGNLLRMAAWLIDCGANPVEIYDRVMNSNSPAKLKLNGMALSALQCNAERDIWIIHLGPEQLKDYSVDDTEGLVMNTLMVEGAKIGALITQWPEGLIKISIRSKPGISINEIAAAFGGGGHAQASGARTTIAQYQPEQIRDFIYSEGRKKISIQ
jgi:phosphoesterase RecJ-like protein